jgi:hypothetical protein
MLSFTNLGMHAEQVFDDTFVHIKQLYLSRLRGFNTYKTN